ncbi:MAG: hypothetical protein JXA03_09270 [Bacteroidales bacterium]|nr:hypothetical protein [Bacteroidales bacterium]
MFKVSPPKELIFFIFSPIGGNVSRGWFVRRVMTKGVRRGGFTRGGDGVV